MASSNFEIGDHHIQDRLRAVRDLAPNADRLEKPAAGRNDGGGTRVAAGSCIKRRIGDDNGKLGSKTLTQRQRQRQSGQCATTDDNASLC